MVQQSGIPSYKMTSKISNISNGQIPQWWLQIQRERPCDMHADWTGLVTTPRTQKTTETNTTLKGIEGLVPAIPGDRYFPPAQTRSPRWEKYTNLCTLNHRSLFGKCETSDSSLFELYTPQWSTTSHPSHGQLDWNTYHPRIVWLKILSQAFKANLHLD